MRRRSFRSTVLLSVLLFATVLTLVCATAPAARAEQVSAWSLIGAYPATTVYDGFPNNGSIGISSASCVSSSGYMYCIGGDNLQGPTNSTTYVELSQLGLTSIQMGAEYPLPVDSASCVASGAFVYCVGGEGTFRNSTSLAYYAPVSGSGIGSWKQTTSYPVNASDLSCVTSGSDVYCLGGTQEQRGESEPAYYAAIGSSGIGAWQQTTSYPGWVMGQACFSSSSEMYCVGGFTTAANPTNATMEASLSSGGIGPWQQGTGFPYPVQNQACVTLSGYAYCIAGQDMSGGGGVTITNANSSVYFSQLSSSGLGAWQQTASLPTPTFDLACVSSTYMYCIGGLQFNNDTLANDILSSGPPPTVTNVSTSVEQPSSTTLTTTITSNLVISGTFTSSSNGGSSVALVSPSSLYAPAAVAFVALAVIAIARMRSRPERAADRR